MRAATLGGFLVLPWSSGGAEPELRSHGLLEAGALLGVTVFCENHTATEPRLLFTGSLRSEGGREAPAPCLRSSDRHLLQASSWNLLEGSGSQGHQCCFFWWLLCVLRFLPGAGQEPSMSLVTQRGSDIADPCLMRCVCLCVCVQVWRS